MVESDKVVARTKKWISEVVIGCRMCPFAAKEFNRGAIHYRVEIDSDTEACLRAFLEECRRLDANPSIETTLLILPGAFPDFEDYLDLVEMAEDRFLNRKATKVISDRRLSSRLSICRCARR
jgi:uncharacterized protein